jgi:hypothetical protein
MFEKKI